MSCSVSQGSREFIYVPLVARVEGVAVAPEVYLSFSLKTPEASDWIQAVYIDGYARVLMLGDLPRGKYFVWVRVRDLPEDVVMKSGVLTVT